MTPNELSVIILTIVGAIMQLLFRYAPKIKDWYAALGNKGLFTLAAVAVVGAAYIGLACTPFAAQLKIAVACEEASVFTYLQAVLIIATSQQLTYLYTRSSAKA